VWTIAVGVVTLAFWLMVAVIAVIAVIATVVVKIVIGAVLLTVRIVIGVCRNLFRTFLT
jgi:hypothetical protein